MVPLALKVDVRQHQDISLLPAISALRLQNRAMQWFLPGAETPVASFSKVERREIKWVECQVYPSIVYARLLSKHEETHVVQESRWWWKCGVDEQEIKDEENGSSGGGNQHTRIGLEESTWNSQGWWRQVFWQTKRRRTAINFQRANKGTRREKEKSICELQVVGTRLDQFEKRQLYWSPWAIDPTRRRIQAVLRQQGWSAAGVELAIRTLSVEL